MRWMVVAAALLGALLTGGCLQSLHAAITGDAGPKDFVSGTKYHRMVVEVDSVPGMEPPAGVLDLLKTRLLSVVTKPDGVDIQTGAALATHGGTWSDRDILDVAQASRNVKTSGSTAALHVLFLDGTYRQANVLGVTFAASDHSSSGPIAIFSQSIRDSCSSVALPPCFDATPGWKAVLVHEAGHALGLVNNGIPMVQAHEASTCNNAPDKGHSNDQSSVMFCSVEQSGLFTFFTGGPPTDFDAADRADFCHAGGKC